MSDRDVLWGDELLWDHLILDREGEPVGMVDDLELIDPGDGGGPVLTAILCGPTALGARIGGRIGVWWTAIGRRLRASEDPYPPRIPLALVERIDVKAVHLAVFREAVPTSAFRNWVLEKIICRIPGNDR